MSLGDIRVVEAAGSWKEIGVAHGQLYKDEIRRYSAERLSHIEAGQWTKGEPVETSKILKLAEACLPAHQAYSPQLYQEWLGLSESTGLSMAELVVVGGYTDFIDTVYAAFNSAQPLEPPLLVDDCTAFLIPNERSAGAGFFGQTWDMHATATEFVILLDVRPADAPNALVFSTTGCVGQIGMNEHGIAIGINNLLGNDGQIGVTWPFVVRKALMQDNFEDALACITEAELAGAHNFLLMDQHGNGANVEAMPSHRAVTKLETRPIIHTNHCLIPAAEAYAQTRIPESQTWSESRLDFAEDALLQRETISIEDLQTLTAQPPVCTVSTAPLFIESCGAAIMRPKTREFWAVWGLPSENPYRRFVVQGG